MLSKTFTVTDINGLTNVTIEREATDDELAQIAIDAAAAKAAETAEATKAAEKAALLTRLGITADEAKLLLG